MSSIIDDIFNKGNLVPALIIGLVIILIVLFPTGFFWLLVILAIFVVVIGLLIFLKDTKDLMPLVVMIIGIIALVLLFYQRTKNGW